MVASKVLAVQDGAPAPLLSGRGGRLRQQDGEVRVRAWHHCVPDNVSWPNYAYYAQALKRLVGKA